ncbi:hypothetical protein ACVWZA_002802 [Sphingomonas sp. UYAg733]
MNRSEEEITYSDFVEHPVWHFDYETEEYSPVLSLDHPIDSIDYLFYRAKFTSPQGFEFEGRLTSTGEDAIAVFRNGRWYGANKAWKEISIAQFYKLALDSTDLDISDGLRLFPLTFQTIINQDPFIDWSGIFDLPR